MSNKKYSKRKKKEKRQRKLFMPMGFDISVLPPPPTHLRCVWDGLDRAMCGAALQGAHLRLPTEGDQDEGSGHCRRLPNRQLEQKRTAG